MTLLPFPARSRMRWRRIDVPGLEEAIVEQTSDGWRRGGVLSVEAAAHAGRRAGLAPGGGGRQRRAVARA